MNNPINITKPPVMPLAQNVVSTSNRPTRPGTVILLDPSPYPEVKGNHDPATVAMLKNDYAGLVSELTAITQYIFQNNSSDDETFANAMLQIAISEMQHLDLLGDAIHTLGGTTEFTDGNHRFWTAANVNYANDRAGMLRANIQAEQAAIANYERHAAATSNESVRRLLLRIADDERLHLKFFEEQLAKLQHGGQG